MQLGIFAKTFPGNTPAVVMQAAATAGYSTVQYNMACSGLPPMPGSISAETAQAVASASRSTGVGLAAVSGTFNMIHPDRRVVDAGLASLAVLAARCRDMGTGLITLCTGSRDAGDQWRHHPGNALPDAWRDLSTAMEKALTIAEAHDVDLGIEPELANVVNSAEQAQRLIRQMASPRLKIVLDAANLFEVASLGEQRRTVSHAVDMLAGHLAMAHAKDRAADGAFVAAGTGVLDYAHYLHCLKAAGFSGPLVTHGLAPQEADGVAQFLRQRLAALDGHSA